MLSQESVSHSVHTGRGWVSLGPFPFQGDGYFWYQVPFLGGYVQGVGMSGGGMSRGVRSTHRPRSLDMRRVPISPATDS